MNSIIEITVQRGGGGNTPVEFWRRAETVILLLSARCQVLEKRLNGEIWFRGAESRRNKIEGGGIYKPPLLSSLLKTQPRERFESSNEDTVLERRSATRRGMIVTPCWFTVNSDML